MIIWSSSKIEHALASGTLESWDSAKYVVCIILINSLSGPAYIFSPSYGEKPSGFGQLISAVGMISSYVIIYYGIRKCYAVNKSIDDKDFAGRFAALYVSLTVKFMAFMLPLSIIVATIAYRSSFGLEYSDHIMYLTQFGVVVGTYVFYVLLQRSFMRLGNLIMDIDDFPNKSPS